MEYPNSGVLWTSTLPNRHAQAPDMYGDIKIDVDLLQNMINESQGSSVTIKLDGWRKKDKNGNAMVSLKLNTYKKQDQQQSQDNGKDPWDD